MWINSVTMVIPRVRFPSSVKSEKESGAWRDIVHWTDCTCTCGTDRAHRAVQPVLNYLVSYQVIHHSPLLYKHVCTLGDNQRETSIPEKEGLYNLNDNYNNISL